MVQFTTTAAAARDESTQEKTINQYKLGSTVGRGTFCKVKWARDSSNGTGYGVKVLSRTVMERTQVAVFRKGAGGEVGRICFGEAIQTEIELLRGLEHTGIVALHEVIDDPGHQDLYLIYEGMGGGELMQFRDKCKGYEVSCDAAMAKEKWGDKLRCEPAQPARPNELHVFTEGAARFLSKQMLEAVVYLHEKAIIHKDLKPDNLLLSLPLPASDKRVARLLHGFEDWPKPRIEDAAAVSSPSAVAITDVFQKADLQVKVCDFGCSQPAEPPEYRIYDAIGTHLFSSPECFEALSFSDDGILGKPRDVWSLGCTLFIMLFGRCPFWKEDNLSLQFEIMAGQFEMPESVVSMQAMDFIKGLMQKEPGDRLTAVSALQHRFLQPPESLP